jgi:hypothetical protein
MQRRGNLDIAIDHLLVQNSSPLMVRKRQHGISGLLSIDNIRIILEVLNDAQNNFTKSSAGFHLDLYSFSSSIAVVIFSWHVGRAWSVSFVVLILMLTEMILERHIGILRATEIPQRLRHLTEELELRGLEYGEVKEPPSGAINLIRVRRDHHWSLLPVNLLVTGDIVQASPDDDLGVACAKRPDVGSTTDLVQIQETPIFRQLEIIASLQRTCPLWEDEWKRIAHFLYVLEILYALTRFALDSLGIYNPKIHQNTVPLVLLIVHLLLSPIWKIIFASYGTARIISLAEVLQKSKTPYLEAEDVDEFDEEAPPPTKDIYLNPLDIAKKALLSFSLKFNGFLYWQSDLVDSFASVSVLSFLDREGPIANVKITLRVVNGILVIPYAFGSSHPQSQDR